MIRKLFVFLILLIVFAMGTQQVQASEIRSEILELSFSESHVLDVQMPFAIRALSLEKIEGVVMRVWSEGSWSSWSSFAYEEPGLDWSQLMYLDSTSFLQLKSETLEDVRLFVMAFEPQEQLLASHERFLVQNNSSSFHVISRNEWGADEALGTYNPKDIQDSSGPDPVDICEPISKAYPGQYQTQGRVDYSDRNGRNLIWPREYSKQVKKIVIHHTAQNMKDLNDDGRIDQFDYRLSVQAIYRFHTVSRGWGDLGYHYLVDPYGNVYEGRAGGQNVIGGHVLCQNSNTIGVSLMGNFENIRVPRQQYDGLVQITQQLVEKYKINPQGKSSFRGEILPHIVTHGEIGEVTSSLIGRGATACPGRHMKSMMSRLRTAVAGEINVESADTYGYSVSGVPSVVNIPPLTEVMESVTIRNTGTVSWNSLEIFDQNGKNYANLAGISVFPQATIDVPIVFIGGFEAGRKKLQMQVLLNGREEMKETFVMTSVVPRPRYRYEVKEGSDLTERVLVGQESSISLQIKNTSNFSWLNSGEYQVVLKPVTRRRNRVFVNTNAPSVSFANVVDPGETAVVSVDLPAQQRKGSVEFEYLPVMGSEKGFQGTAIKMALSVENPLFAVELETVERRIRLQKGTEKLVEFSLNNTSNFDWEPGMVWFQLDGGDRIDVNRAVKKNDGIVLSVPVRAGYGDRNVFVQGTIGLDGLPSFLEVRRFRKETLDFEEKLTASGRPQLVFEKIGQSTDSISREKGVYEEWVEYKNVGNVPWYAEGNDAVSLQVKDTADLIHRSWRNRKIAGVLQQDIVMPGQIGTFVLQLEVKRSPRREISDTFEPVVKGQRVKVKKGFGVFSVPGRDGGESTKLKTQNLKQGVEKNVSSVANEREKVAQIIEAPVQQQGLDFVEESGDIPAMRVWLSDFDQDVVEITSSGKFLAMINGSFRTYEGGEVFRIVKKDVAGGKVYRIQAQDRPALEVVNWDRSKTFGSRTYNDNTYRNILEIREVDDKVVLINELSLEDYMKGVAEVPESTDQPEEKRKTIAVLARSYALHYLISDYKKFPGKPYNAAESPAIFQKYLGFGFEERSPKWQQVLKDTVGEVVMVESSPIKRQNLKKENLVLRAAYFSCTDGERTKSWDEVWNGNEYFQSFGDVFQSVGDPLGDDPGRSGLQSCGHQVGLSGYGATQMARNGKNYRDIIGYYYRGVFVDKY